MQESLILYLLNLQLKCIPCLQILMISNVQLQVYIILKFQGGDLHNQIGIGNDALSDIYKSLNSAGFNQVVCDIKKFLDSSKTVGGAGCTPAAHHGGQYNGKAGQNLCFVPKSSCKISFKKKMT